MEFTQPEIIQVLRRRLGINQADLGAKAFDTSLDSGRAKVKNIELGKQIPTDKDLRKLASVLGVGVTELLPVQANRTAQPQAIGFRYNLVLHDKVAKMFPGLGDYLSVLNKAVVLEDDELVAYTCRKIVDLLANDARDAVNQ